MNSFNPQKRDGGLPTNQQRFRQPIPLHRFNPQKRDGGLPTTEPKVLVVTGEGYWFQSSKEGRGSANWLSTKD